MSSAINLFPVRTSVADAQKAIDAALAKQPKSEKEPNYPMLAAELASLIFQRDERRRAIKLVSASVKELKAKHKSLTAERATLAALRPTSERINNIYGLDKKIHRLDHLDDRGRKAGLLNDEVERLAINERVCASLEQLIASFTKEHPNVEPLAAVHGTRRFGT
jgi:hypothetical protein